MNRVVGIETEYGCLVSGAGVGGADAWPVRVKDFLFRVDKVGALDRHYRDYEEPPGNGGFLRNGGRIYIDMGHLEYASPECRSLVDAVAYDFAGDRLLQAAVEKMGADGEVAFYRNNIDHRTDATFGCHENYLMRRDTEFDEAGIGTLLSFLATRQIFTGSGRVGVAREYAFDPGSPPAGVKVDFQLSQRADHMVNDIYQWVQFNRSIINARDEPLADFRRYRRLHLLVGDSNVCPFATALKIGTTSLVLTMLEERSLPVDVILADAVIAMRKISHEGTGRAEVMLEDGRQRGALEIQETLLAHARRVLAGRDGETDWILESWGFTLEALREDHSRLLGGVDWVTKRWLLETFRDSEGVEWDDPWLESLDLEYHHIDPAKGFLGGIEPAPRIADWNARIDAAAASVRPPGDTRAAGRGAAVAGLMGSEAAFVVNWDSIAVDGCAPLLMPDPFETCVGEAAALLAEVAGGSPR